MVGSGRLGRLVIRTTWTHSNRERLRPSSETITTGYRSPVSRWRKLHTLPRSSSDEEGSRLPATAVCPGLPCPLAGLIEVPGVDRVVVGVVEQGLVHACGSKHDECSQCS